MTLKKKLSNKIAILFFLVSFGSYSQIKSYKVMEAELFTKEYLAKYGDSTFTIDYNPRYGKISLFTIETGQSDVFLFDVKQSQTEKDSTQTIIEYYSGKHIRSEDRFVARVILDDVRNMYLFSLRFNTEDEDDKKTWHFWCRRKE